ncbi:soluble lytic murein transglycosylase [Synechococcus sp. A18-25c]|nr:lytic transglycosylase domain-containing protein [Synechococcus sp. A18-25c]QNJ18662.1 soluble lytic murein transglycosylase [Synechococcus sp. A18-25c]
MPAVQSLGLGARLTRIRGLLLLGGTSLSAVLAITGGRQLLRQEFQITPQLSSAELWQHYRWSGDPQQRREAALLLASRSSASPDRRWRLLGGQGWGPDPLAAVALKQQALTARALGLEVQEQELWLALLQRFPATAASADARYHLGQDHAELHRELLRQQPRHAAALAAAAELPKDADQQRILTSALHLARWGPQWPGAQSLLREACGAITGQGMTQQERLQLAGALAELGDSNAAELCLQGTPLAPEQALTIGRSLLRGNRQQQGRGEGILLELAHDHPNSPEALAAAALLSEPLRPDPVLLDALPKSVQTASVDVAAARVRLAGGEGGLEVLQRWPDHPSGWQLHWDLAREALLAGRWDEADTWLGAIPEEQLPDPLRARQQFWRGFSAFKRGNDDDAQQIWQTLVTSQPPGYYTWRASARLESADLPELSGTQATNGLEADGTTADRTQHWTALDSGDPLVDQLWRLGWNREALETWQSRDPAGDPSPQNLLVEGRLLMSVNDYWNGLSRLWKSSLRLVDPDCPTRFLLHNSQHPKPLLTQFQDAAQQEQVNLDLLLAIARQESRFSPTVASPVGAQGLLQLMPSTAAEMAGKELSTEQLRQPDLNAVLGARYLAFLLQQWDGNPWLVAASYNAGPGAAGSWVSPELEEDPELWTERIPYPETRLYTKKVLGNLWAYHQLTSSGDRCTE